MILMLVMSSCSAGRSSMGVRQGISPYDFGLKEARTDIDRYNILYKTHQAAVRSGSMVDYSGIPSINLEIPAKAKPIPLSPNTDFRNCIIIVKNKQKDVFLFETVQQGATISLSGEDIDCGKVSLKEHGLDRGSYLIVINDEKPWVENRIGYRYGHTRKDILLLKNGKAENAVVSSYNNPESSPICMAIKVLKEPFVFANLTVNRSAQSTAITNVVNISGYNNVQIKNVNINTPESLLHADRAIKICNSTNVTLDHIVINGTYSQIEESGYGIYLDNIWNFNGSNIQGDGNWGVFGNNNLNVVCVKDSKINRFDVHCYGRDMFFKNVHFFNLYNQFASVFGKIVFEDCLFDNSVPLINGTTYNSYVPYDVYFKNCTMNVMDGKNYILKLGNNDNVINKRKELSEKCWPNIYIDNFTINLSDEIQHFYVIINKEGTDLQNLGYISEIKVNGMVLKTNNSRFRGVWMSKSPLRTNHPVKCHITDVSLNGRSQTKSRSVSPVPVEIRLTGDNFVCE